MRDVTGIPKDRAAMFAQDPMMDGSSRADIPLTDTSWWGVSDRCLGEGR